MMATSEMLEDLEDFLTCSICLEELKGRNPKSLPCLHVFCSQCLDNLLEMTIRDNDEANWTVICPTCCMPAEIPDGSMANLPTCIYINKLEMAMTQLKKTHSACNICQVTDLECELMHYCFQCTLAMCQSCFKNHDEQFTGHVLIPVTGSTLRYMMCKKHEKYLEAFCIDCNKILCKQCMIQSHSTHKICSITSDDKRDIKILIKLLSDREESADKALDHIETVQNRFNCDMDAAGDQLERHHNNLITQLKKQYDAFKLQLDDRRTRVNDNLEKARKMILNAKECILRMQEQSKIWENPIVEIPEINVTGVPVGAPVVSVTIEKPNRLVFMPSSDELLLGEITETEDTKPSEIPNMLYRIPKLTSVKKFGYLSNGMLVVGDYEKGLQVYTDSVSPIEHPLSGKCSRDISHIAVHNTDIVAVMCVDSTVRIFTKDGPKWFENSFFAYDDMLVAFTISGEVILCDRVSLFNQFIMGHGMICKYNRQGQQVWKKPLPGGARDICVDSRDRVVICYKDRVTVYDKYVMELFSIQTTYTNNAIVPCCVCIDDQDNILVADSTNKAVLLFDDHGTYIKFVLPHPALLCGLALNSCKSLAVSVSGTIQVYKL